MRVVSPIPPAESQQSGGSQNAAKSKSDKAYARLSRYELYLFEAKTRAVKNLAKHVAESDPVEAAAALIKATGNIDTAVDLLIAAERSIVSMVPVSKPVVEYDEAIVKETGLAPAPVDLVAETETNGKEQAPRL
jgi:hypothetical protein